MYRHDCNQCKYLGSYEGSDLYFCEREPTVIARYSSDPPDYSSGLVFCGSNAPLKEAARRAIQAGFIDENHAPNDRETLKELIK